MANYDLVVYGDAFRKFKNISNDLIRGLPAKDDDEFLTMTASSASGVVGFKTCEDSEEFIRRLLNRCFYLDASKNRICRPGEQVEKNIPGYIFMSKGGEFEVLVKEYEDYVLSCKKHRVLSKYHDVPSPAPALLSVLIDDDRRKVSVELYESLLATCHFFGIRISSGEHGWGAFDLVSSSMDHVLNIISDLAAPSGNIKFVNDAKELPYN